MVNVGGGDIDGLEKRDHEMKVISGSEEKLFVRGNLIRGTSASGDAIEKATTNLP